MQNLSEVRSRGTRVDTASSTTDASSSSARPYTSKGVFIFVSLLILGTLFYASEHLYHQSNNVAVLPASSMSHDDARLWRLQQSELFKQKSGLPNELSPVVQQTGFRSLEDSMPTSLNDNAIVCQQPKAQQDTCHWDVTMADPASLFSYQVSHQLLAESNGLVVRIFYKDQCCSSNSTKTSPPLAYFRVHVTGAVLTTSHPLVSVGTQPSYLRGHVNKVSLWKGEAIELPSNADGNRVTQTVIQLSDFGNIDVRVELLAFGIPNDLYTRFFWNDKPDATQPNQGRWLIHQPTKVEGTNTFVAPPSAWIQTVTGDSQVSLSIPESDAVYSRSTDSFLRSKLPLCGANKPMQSNLEEDGFISGRWRFDSLNKTVTAMNPVTLPRERQFENSRWIPHQCLLHGTRGDSRKSADTRLSTNDAITRHKWIHFVGDDRIASLFHVMCRAKSVHSRLYMTPKNKETNKRPDAAPMLCYGFASKEDADKENYQAIRWVMTYEKWSLHKELPLREFPHFTDKTKPSLFYYNSACAKYQADAVKFVGGWPNCGQAPKFVQTMFGPSVTFFGFGREHMSQLGYDATKSDKKKSSKHVIQATLQASYFKRYTTLFVLSPPVAENRLSATYSNVDEILPRMNNIRIHGFNKLLIELIQDMTSPKRPVASTFASRANQGFKQGHSWLPVVDVFSPLYSAIDAVLPLQMTRNGASQLTNPHHWEESRQVQFLDEQLMVHYLIKCPNIQGAPVQPVVALESKKVTESNRKDVKANTKPASQNKGEIARKANQRNSNKLPNKKSDVKSQPDRKENDSSKKATTAKSPSQPTPTSSTPTLPSSTVVQQPPEKKAADESKSNEKDAPSSVAASPVPAATDQQQQQSAEKKNEVKEKPSPEIKPSTTTETLPSGTPSPAPQSSVSPASVTPVIPAAQPLSPVAIPVNSVADTTSTKKITRSSPQEVERRKKAMLEEMARRDRINRMKRSQGKKTPSPPAQTRKLAPRPVAAPPATKGQ